MITLFIVFALNYVMQLSPNNNHFSFFSTLLKVEEKCPLLANASGRDGATLEFNSLISI